MSDYNLSNTYWPVDYWPVDYWPEAGVTPPVVAPSGGAGGIIQRLYGTNYSIWLSNPNGIRIRLIDRFISLNYTLAINGIGVLKLELGKDFPLSSLVQEDSQLEVFRQVPGGKKYRDGDAKWLIRDWEQNVASNGLETITLLAYSAPEILDRAIIAYAAGSAQANKSVMPVDNLIKALIRENLGSLATDTARNRAYLVVDSDLGQGPTTSKSMSWRPLLPVLRELAQDSDDQGSPTFFDVIYPAGSSTLVARTYAGQRGDDHSQVGPRRVVLSQKTGSLAEVKRLFTSRDERNVIYVGGSGQESNRLVVTVDDPARTAVSPLNRREMFVNQSNVGDAAVLQAEGAAALRNYRARETFSAKVRDSRAIRYGLHYGFGDRLVAEFGTRTANIRIDAVEINVSQGKEDIRVTFRVDEQ